MGLLEQANKLVDTLKGQLPSAPFAHLIIDELARMDQLDQLRVVVGQLTGAREDAGGAGVPPQPQTQPVEQSGGRQAYRAFLIQYRDSKPNATVREMLSDLAAGRVTKAWVDSLISGNGLETTHLCEAIAHGYPEHTAAMTVKKAEMDAHGREMMARIRARRRGGE
jgi:hypothetical protein